MSQRDDLLSRIRDAQAIVKELEIMLPKSKTPQDRVSRQEEIRRQKQMVLNLKSQWMSLNPGQPFPFSV